MFAVTIDLDQYDTLPPRQLKAMLRALRFADEGGVVRASLTMLATPGLSRSTAHRELAGLEEAGLALRQERPEGGFLWRIGRRFRGARSPGTVRPHPEWAKTRESHSSPSGGKLKPHTEWATNRKSHTSGQSGSTSTRFGTPVPPAETPVPQRGTTDSRAPARLELSSGSKEPSERELSLSEGEIPSGWEEAAAAERGLAGLGPVNLRAEWRKLVAYSEGQRITIWRWRGWALKARGDTTLTSHLDTLPQGGAPPANGALTRHLADILPGDDRQQRQARDWVRTGFWLRSGAWCPAPDQPGCNLPVGLVAWCLRERAVAAA